MYRTLIDFSQEKRAGGSLPVLAIVYEEHITDLLTKNYKRIRQNIPL